MSDASSSTAGHDGPAGSAVVARLYWFYLLFFLSGISGLMYEVVWVRMLTRILGSTVYATSTVLAAYMAGLVLGSFLVGRIIDRARSPIFWYALLELGIGLSALASLALPDRLVPIYRAMYTFAGNSRQWLQFGQVITALAVLLVPTALMGATLPTLSVYGARVSKNFGQYVGILYGFNTLGALIGVLGSGFFLIGEIGEMRTLGLGVALNLAVAGAALLLSRKIDGSPMAVPANAEVHVSLPPGLEPVPSAAHWVLLTSFAVSGFVALANEVIWSRMLILYQGTSIYAFSSMLAVVLGGMGLGSFIGSKMVQNLADPLRRLATLQLAVGLFQVVALRWYDRQGEGFFEAPIMLLGPLGFLWGLAFPVGAVCYARSAAAAGRSVSELYAWNTLGCIAGALGAGFLLIPSLGASRSIMALAILSSLMGLIILWRHPAGFWQRARAFELGLVIAIGFFMATAGDSYYRLLMRVTREVYPEGSVVYKHVEEAAATTTALGKLGGKPREKQLLVNGVGMTELVDVTKMMAHLPLALADDPKDMLIICFGMGTTMRSASRHEGLQIHIVELVPAVLRFVEYFHADGPAILRQPNVHPHADDGRNYLLMHPQQYDVITIDPPPPLYSAGAVNLYTKEFFELCRSHLRPGGVLCMWILPDRASEMKMIMRTFFDVFEYTKVWSGTAPYPGVLLLGSLKPIKDISERIQALYRKPAVVADLAEWSTDLDGPQKMIDLYAGDGDLLRPEFASVNVITDDTPYTEFFLWRARARDSEYEHNYRPVPIGIKPGAGEAAQSKP
jgi:spermidine synthase